MDNNSTELKQCSNCKSIKPLSDFSIHIFGKYGRQGYCKACGLIKSRDRYKARKELFTSNQVIEVI